MEWETYENVLLSLGNMQNQITRFLFLICCLLAAGRKPNSGPISSEFETVVSSVLQLSKIRTLSYATHSSVECSLTAFDNAPQKAGRLILILLMN